MKTEATPFYDVPVVADDAFVFEVRAGIPADLALDLATCQLDAAILTIREAAGSLGKRSETGPLYAALYTLEQAYALCNSISRSVMRSTDEQAGEAQEQEAPPAPSVCELLDEIDWYLSKPQLRALRRLADERFDGNLKMALASLFEGALEELEGADQ